MAQEATLSILLSLKNKFSKPLETATKDTKDFEKRLKNTKNTLKSWKSSAIGAFDSVAAKAGKMALAISGIGSVLSVASLSSFTSQCEELAREETNATTKLQSMLANVPSIAKGGQSAINAAYEDLTSYADELESTGVVGADVIEAGQQQLASFQLSEETLHDLSKGMAEMLAQTKGLEATQDDAVSAANMIGKAMSGQATAMSRVGVVIDDAQKKILETGTEAEKLAAMQDILKFNYGTVNEDYRNTDEGKLWGLQTEWEGMMTEMGHTIVSLKAQFADVATDILPDIEDALMDLFNSAVGVVQKVLAYIKENKEEVKDAIKGAIDFIKTLGGVLKDVFAFVYQNRETIGRVLLSVVSVMTLLSAGTKAIDGIKKIKEGFDKVKDVISVIRLAGLGPIAIVIAAIVAIVILLIANWDKVKAKVEEIVKNLKEKHKPTYDAICKIIGTIKSVFWIIVSAVSQVAGWLADIAGWLIDHIDPALDDIFLLFDSIATIVDTILTSIEDLCTWLDKALDKLDSLNGGNSLTFNAGESGNYRDALGFASGTTYFGGGVAEVGEHGGEILNLPSGTQIIPHDVSKKMVNNNQSISVNVNISGNIIGNNQYAEWIGDYLQNRVQVAMAAK